jgi:hypothetical protein
MSAPAHGRGPHPGAVDPRRVEYDARKSLLSLCITFVVAAVVFGGFYLFSPRGPDVPTGPAVEQPINQTAPSTPDAQDESALLRVPTAP